MTPAPEQLTPPRPSPLAQWVNNARPHQFVHQVSLIASASAFGGTGNAVVPHALGMAISGTVASMILNDYMHRGDDEAMGRLRPSQRLSKRGFIAAEILCVGTALGLAGIGGGGQAALLTLGVFATTGLYGYAKKLRRPLATYAGRFCMGVFLFAAYASVVAGEHLWEHVVPLALASGLLDLAGNIAGDLRDEAPDRRAGVRTLPVGSGVGVSLAVLLLLLVLGHAVAWPRSSAPMMIGMTGLGWSLVGLIAYAAAPVRWAHGAFHGPKLMMFMAIAAAVAGTGTARWLVSSAAIGLLWLASYAAYVWGMGSAPDTGQTSEGAH